MSISLKPATIVLAAIWFANGLFCKVLNLVPRHQLIVERILRLTDARPITIAIGLGEIMMCIWVISGKWVRQAAFAQIALIATMNTLEYFLAPDLLLWGKWNAAFAFLLIVFIYITQLYKRTLTRKHVAQP